MNQFEIIGSLYDDHSLYETADTMSFDEIYPSAEDFLADARMEGISDILAISQIDIETTLPAIYYLIWGKYANCHIASNDINRFKFRLFSLIAQYAPSWQKRVDIQNKLRQLSDDQISEGAFQMNNHITGSGQRVTNTKEELKTIDNQNTSRKVKGTLEKYAELSLLLLTDVTEEFLNRFQSLFRAVITRSASILYVYEEGSPQKGA